MKEWRGSFAIPMTPFDDHDRIDEEVLAAEIEFCIESGVGGLVAPVMVSEFFVLSEEERRLMIRVPVEVSSDYAAKHGTSRTPVIANCAAVDMHTAVGLARYAEQVGADAVIAMPPYISHPDWGRIWEYYAAINNAVGIPIWIQNAGIVPLSADQVIRLCTELERVSWVKEEVQPETHSISNLLAKACPYVEGVMGGGGGRFMVSEHARGAKGVVHACQFCDGVQAVWNLLDAGEIVAAGDLFEKLLPGLVAEGLMGMAFAKEIMVRRGVFKNNRVRSHSHPLDEGDMREIDRIWGRIQPYLT